MDNLRQEIEKRRTFAIISHPDAGKTTLTEKFLLYGGAINQAGSVKGKATAKHAVSDWMEIEKQRGISVTSSVLQFNYDGYCINILDTPGHQDFSEDTYRTLMAADSAVMVIDASKGVEAQTRKLFKVCVMRHIPIFTFINKMDRDANDTFDLLDEIEKAHPDVFNILLQVLDDGRITDSQGRTVDFKNTVIIMTSNIGAKLLTEKHSSLGFTDENSENKETENTKELVLGELKKAFRPEFINRIDDIIVFDRLSKDEIKEIAVKMLAGLKKRLSDMEIEIEFTDEAVSAIADKGFDEVYGARPLRRAITSDIEDPLSEKMLDGTIKANSKVKCDFADGKFTFAEVK